MSRKPSALAALDIVAEGFAQQDGLAERLSRQRAARTADAAAGAATPEPGRAGQPAREHNAWRRGKALLQVAIAEETHLELGILARRRRMTLSQLVKEALNQWLDSHGHTLRVPK